MGTFGGWMAGEADSCRIELKATRATNAKLMAALRDLHEHASGVAGTSRAGQPAGLRAAIDRAEELIKEGEGRG